MSRGGRPKHKFWEEGGFELQKRNHKTVAFCMYCKVILANTAEVRLKAHRNKCPPKETNEEILENHVRDIEGDLIEEVKEYDNDSDFSSVYSNELMYEVVVDQEISEIGTLEYINTSHPVMIKSEDHNRSECTDMKEVNYIRIMPTTTSEDNKEPEKNASGLSSSVYSISQKSRSILRSEYKSQPINLEESNEKSIDDTLASFFFECNIPFNVVESSEFKKLITMLNPKYKLPTKKSLSDMLLRKIHKKLLLSEAEFNDSDGVLVMKSPKKSTSKTQVKRHHNESDNDVFFLYKRKRLN